MNQQLNDTAVRLRPSGEFIQERKYLLNVSAKTLIFYQCSFKAFEGALDFQGAKQRVCELRERGVKPVSINTYLTCLNAYWKWNGLDWRLRPLKEEQKILATLSLEQIQRIIHWKPVGRNLTRAHAACLTILDCGLRISECLAIKRTDLDFDNLIIRVKGKGNKHRLVPMSIELRKALFRFCGKQSHELVFSTRNGTRVTTRNFERDMTAMSKRLGITGVRFSPHTLRHTFAVGYLRAGGNLFYLSRILGHTSVKTTERYLQSLGIEDLQKVHDGLSLLGIR